MIFFCIELLTTFAKKSMKISYNWLKNYIKLDLSPKRVADILTSIGLEVESIDEFETIKGGLKGIIVGEVVECEKHPNADRLSVTKVNIGEGKLLTIVCGAPNVAKGQKVPVATVGTKLYKGKESIEIKEAMLRGVLSQGMICAEDEIGLGSSHDGIMVLADNLKPGTPLSELFDVYHDVVFEIGLTPNRIDAASHYGIARDLAAYLQHHNPVILERPSVGDFKVDCLESPISVEVHNTEACPRYSGVVISNVQVKESPSWLKNYLLAIGLRPINNIVDITNFVLHETGQPLHAFDYDKIKGNKIIVRTVEEGTSFITLDGVERKLSSSDLMICNEEEPMCIAGVYGGLDSGVTEKTTTIFIESAYFNPVYIRKTSRRLGITTDSSFRFERGTDPNNTIYALKRAAQLIKDIAGGMVSSDIIDVYPQKIEEKIIELEYSYVEDVIGQNISKKTLKEILLSLEISIIAEKEKSLLLSIPTYRVDVYRPIDVVEEILRIYGFNTVVISENLNTSINYSNPEKKEEWYRVIANLLVSNGFYELMNNSLTKIQYYKDNSVYPLEHCVQLLNPLSQDLAVLRQTLLYSGLESIVYNINRQSEDIKFFEFGMCYFLPEPSKNEKVENYIEEEFLSLFVTGKKTSQSWLVKEDNVNYFYLKRWVETILSRMDIKPTSTALVQSPIFEYGLNYFYKNDKIVSLGLIEPSVLSMFDIKQEVYYAEIAWQKLLQLVKNKEITYQELPKFPMVRRDLAMLLDKNITYETLEKIAYNVCGNVLKKVNLFDVYEGKNIPDNKKSYALSFYLQSLEKTLSDEEINAIMSKLMTAFEKEVQAIIRQ